MQTFDARRRHRDLRAHRRRAAPAARAPGRPSTPSEIGDMALLARDRAVDVVCRPRRARRAARRPADPGRGDGVRARGPLPRRAPGVRQPQQHVRSPAAAAGAGCRRRGRGDERTLPGPARGARPPTCGSSGSRQPIDTERLVPRRAPSDVPRRALLLGNYLTGDARRLIVDTWSDLGVEVVQVGMDTDQTLQPEVEIAAADIVVGKAPRGAGRHVVRPAGLRLRRLRRRRLGHRRHLRRHRGRRPRRPGLPGRHRRRPAAQGPRGVRPG